MFGLNKSSGLMDSNETYLHFSKYLILEIFCLVIPTHQHVIIQRKTTQKERKDIVQYYAVFEYVIFTD